MTQESQNEHAGTQEGMDYLDMLTVLARHWRSLVAIPLVAGAAAFAATYAITPTFTARTTLLTPQQQQSSTASALASLGALGGLAGASLNIKSPADQYVSLMQTDVVLDRVIDKFGLKQLYKTQYRAQAREKLLERVRISLGKKDALITIETDAPSAQMAADMANSFVAELRRLTANLALTEAQQRRVFFEKQVRDTHQALITAQQALQATGFNAGALKAEPKATADSYARLLAETTAADVKLQALRRNLADNAPEVQQQTAILGALRSQLSQLERGTSPGASADYVSTYREFKYQEALFEVYSKQFELARVDESREGMLIQVVDVAQPPERKSGPKRILLAASVGFGALVLMMGVLIVHAYFRTAARDPLVSNRFSHFRSAFGRGQRA